MMITGSSAGLVIVRAVLSEPDTVIGVAFLG